MKKIFDNIQAIFIVILATALILSFIFRPSKPIETYENEINSLKQQNQQLLLSNDSINLINAKLQKEINVIEKIIGQPINEYIFRTLVGIGALINGGKNSKKTSSSQGSFNRISYCRKWRTMCI